MKVETNKQLMERKREPVTKRYLCDWPSSKELVAYLFKMILRPAPMFWPAWVAPLFVPAWRPMAVLPAAIVSSLNSRLFSSEGLGPNQGPGHSGCLYDYL